MSTEVGAGGTAHPATHPFNERPRWQKITYGIAMFFYIVAAGLGLATWLYDKVSTQDPIWASMLATTLFLISVGFVLQVIANTRLKGILNEPAP